MKSAIQEFKVVRAAAAAVKEMTAAVSTKAASVDVYAGAYIDGSDTIILEVRFSAVREEDAVPFPGARLARCLAVAVQKNIEALLVEAAVEVDAVVEAVKSEALAEAQAVIREIES